MAAERARRYLPGGTLAPGDWRPLGREECTARAVIDEAPIHLKQIAHLLLETRGDACSAGTEGHQHIEHEYWRLDRLGSLASGVSRFAVEGRKHRSISVPEACQLQYHSGRQAEA